MIIEGSSVIVIIEIKKKQLSAKSRTGDMASLFLDLGSSLLHAQLQAGKVELLLKSRGFIEVTHGTNAKKIYWSNKEVIRITVTHYDYFGLQDRITAKQILKTFVERNINPDPSSSQEILDGYKTIQKHASNWVAQYKNLAELDKEFAEDPFYSSWFLSVGQLLLLLENASTNDDFIKNLEKTKSISLSSNNFYYEYLFCENLDNPRNNMVFMNIKNKT